jgi:hypothetical protein
VDEDEVKRKVRPPEPSLKHCHEVTDGTVTGEEAAVREELEAELMVTRICDGILGRLNEAKTQRDQHFRKQRVRRPQD